MVNISQTDEKCIQFMAALLLRKEWSDLSRYFQRKIIHF